MAHSWRSRHTIVMAILSAALLFLTWWREGWAEEDPQDNYYGFVVYTFDEDHEGSTPPDGFQLIKSLGAGWVQGEAGGMGVRTQAIVWDKVVPWNGKGKAPDLTNQANYNYDTLYWIDQALAQGLNVVTSIETGRSGWTRTSGCGVAPNCVPKEWSQWYQFVYQVVRHFSEKGVRRFKSTEEACLNWNYFGGAKEDMYGSGAKETIIDAKGRRKEVLKGIIPVAHLATHDANPEAVFAAGSAAGAGPALAFHHLFGLYNKWTKGRPAKEWPRIWNQVRAQAKESYDIDLSGFTAQQVKNNRARQFVEQSLKYPQTYDAYSIHLYDQFRDSWGFMTSEGFTRSMFFARSQLPPKKPLWITGTGILAGNLPAWNPYQEGTPSRVAHHLLRTLVGAYASGVDWITYSSLGNPAANCRPPEKCDTSLFGYRNYPYRNNAADTFSLMTRIFPTKDSFSYECTLQGDATSLRFGTCQSGWEGEFEADARIVMHKFSLVSPKNRKSVKGSIAAGWCLDLDPGQKGQSWHFDNPGCPTTVNLGQISSRLGIAEGDPVAIFDFRGNLTGKGIAGPGNPLAVVFDEAPFLIVWGADQDLDGIPDVADNCPATPNPDQMDDVPPGQEILAGHHNPAIDAPDGIGYACDTQPLVSNRDQQTF